MSPKIFMGDHALVQHGTVFERLQFLVLTRMAGREIASERSENERKDGSLLHKCKPTKKFMSYTESLDA